MKAAILAAPLLLLATIAQARDISSEIDAANAKWIAAFNKGDAAAVAQLYTERATALPPGAPMPRGVRRSRRSGTVRSKTGSRTSR